MSVKVTIICNGCGYEITGATYARAWQRCKALGWVVKIAKANAKFHFCNLCLKSPTNTGFPSYKIEEKRPTNLGGPNDKCCRH